jgi:hypothetical protein
MKVKEQFVASFPENSTNQTPSEYLVLKADKIIVGYFKREIRQYASENEVWVSLDSHKEIKDGTPVSTQEISATRFRLYKILNDKKQRLALIGLIASVCSIAVNGALTIGKEHPIFIVSEFVIAFSMWSALMLQIVGAVLLFWKGILEG